MSVYYLKLLCQSNFKSKSSDDISPIRQQDIFISTPPWSDEGCSAEEVISGSLNSI